MEAVNNLSGKVQGLDQSLQKATKENFFKAKNSSNQTPNVVDRGHSRTTSHKSVEKTLVKKQTKKI